jgi:hypothetical protein
MQSSPNRDYGEKGYEQMPVSTHRPSPVKKGLSSCLIAEQFLLEEEQARARIVDNSMESVDAAQTQLLIRRALVDHVSVCGRCSDGLR